VSTIAVLVGNPQAGSRTRTVAEEVAAQLAAASGADVLPTIELAEHADRLFVFPDASLEALGAAVAAADVLVVATPTYKASYTGLLKAFLDRYGTNGLAGVVAVPVFTIGSPAHALAVEHTLRPLLVELGASVPTRGISFPTERVAERATIVADWLLAAGPLLAPALGGAR